MREQRSTAEPERTGDPPSSPAAPASSAAATQSAAVAARIRLGLPFWEFVALVALAMSITALSIDIMLPALPDIADALQIRDPNDRQYVVLSYVVGFALGQLVSGPCSDRYGRKPVLLAGLALYAAATVFAILATGFTAMLAARVVQGLGGSAPRVVAVAVVRDRFEGRAMARVMSFAMTLFIMVPVLAPSLGGLILFAGSWRWIFGALLVVALVLALWIGLRLPETHPDGGPPRALETLRTILSTRVTVGYTVALGFVFAIIMSYVASAQQLFAAVFGIVDTFPLYFASVAIMMVAASLSNARLVRRVGMRPMSHGALVGLLALGLAALAAELGGAGLGLIAALAFLGLVFFCLGVIIPNTNAIAMEPLGQVAGTGSSLIGFYMTGFGALAGGFVAHLFNGTLLPLIGGIAVFGAAALTTIVVTEPGHFLRPTAGRA